MSERRKINNNHPLYSEYLAKAEILRSKRKESVSLVKSTYGKDNLDILAIDKQFAHDLKKLQQDYSFLFDYTTE